MNEMSLSEQVRQAAALLERLRGDRALLAQLPQEERTRLLQAAGDVYCPDVSERRRATDERIPGVLIRPN